MTELRKIVHGIAIVAALTPAAAQADDRDAVAYRQHIMNTLNEQAAALGQIYRPFAGDRAVGKDRIEGLRTQSARRRGQAGRLGQLAGFLQTHE